MAEVKITRENFESEVMESDVPVLLDFWANWCGPCRSLSPILSEIAEEHPEYKIGKVNVDEEGELAQQFNVMSIPYVVVFKNKKQTASSIGLIPKESVLKLFDK